MTSYERTGWRDEAISRRHRHWGDALPAVDLDFLLVEYNAGYPVALVDYKDCHASMPNLRHPSFRALAWLANARDLPFYVAFYWKDTWAFRVHPVNDAAKKWFREAEVLSEREYVSRLYDMRRRAVDVGVLARLHDERPSPVVVPWLADESA